MLSNFLKLLTRSKIVSKGITREQLEDIIKRYQEAEMCEIINSATKE